MSDPASDLGSGELQFHDRYVPGLTAGETPYALTVSQTVTGDDAAPIADLTQTFAVDAPQFALAPAPLHSVYPPDGSVGRYAETLPFVVLNERALPWERTLDGQPTTTPWLALLAFTQDELVTVSPAPGGDGAPTLNDPARLGTHVASGTIADVVSPPAGFLANALAGTVPDPSLACRYIDLTTETFAAVLPALAEVPFLAHVREVHTGDSTLLGDPEDGWFSVVLANRFPAPPNAAAGDPDATQGLLNIVHLVSLEGFEAYLDAPATTPPGQRVRMVSLADWSFTCLAEPGQSFGGLVRGLFHDADGQPNDADGLRLKLPVAAPANPTGTDPASVAQTRLYTGAVAAPYHTLSGEDTFAWYRGPLTPLPTAYHPKAAPFLSASGAMVYDETNGVFDHSLAAAWQLGRNLALADAPFGQAMLALRRAGWALLDEAVRQQAENGGPLALVGRPDALRKKRSAAQATLAFAPSLLARIGAASGEARSRQQLREGLARLRHRRSGALTAAARPKRRALLSQPAVQDALPAVLTEEIDAVGAWLARLGLLLDVPFDHLVPDPLMLPPETIRFFYYDQNWADAMTDGALSIGMASGIDTAYLQALYAALREAAHAAAVDYRAHLPEGTDLHPGTVDAPEAQAGLLIRSALVSGWPGLIVQARQAGVQLKTLRMEHLAPGVLFCLFLGVPDEVVLSLPTQTLSFGVIVTTEEGTPEEGVVELRAVDGATVGAPLAPVQPVAVYTPGGGATQPFLRPGGGRVLNLAPDGTDPAHDLIPALHDGLGLTTALTPSQFALQLVRSAEYQAFVNTP